MSRQTAPRPRHSLEIMNEIESRQQDIPLRTFTHGIVLGVGGIGSWVAYNLALSARVDVLHIVDPDIVESTNLNRTPFRLCDIAYPKVDALKFLILERRVMDVYTYMQKTDKELVSQLMVSTHSPRYTSDNDRMHEHVVIVDCRDDVYDDFNTFPCKYYKVGYDGMSVTIDGNPRNTAVWGRANGYRFTPSFICPTQLAANLVVSDLLSIKIDKKDAEADFDVMSNTGPFDLYGRMNRAVTFDCRDVLEIMYREFKKGE